MNNLSYDYNYYAKLHKIARENYDSPEVYQNLLEELVLRPDEFGFVFMNEIKSRLKSLASHIPYPTADSWSIRLAFSNDANRVIHLNKLLILSCPEFSLLNRGKAQKDAFISFTGNSWSSGQEMANIMSFFFLQGATIHDQNIWENNQIVFVGREEFNRDYLIQTARLIQKTKISIQFLALEDAHMFHYTPSIIVNYGPKTIINHPGLSFLTSIGFKWPEDGDYPGRYDLPDTTNLNNHLLSTKYHYTVKEGTTSSERTRALEAAVRGLGLQEVVSHIAYLVRYNGNNSKMKWALLRWKEDLDWLYKHKYINTEHSFIWPTNAPE